MAIFLSLYVIAGAATVMLNGLTYRGIFEEKNLLLILSFWWWYWLLLAVEPHFYKLSKKFIWFLKETLITIEELTSDLIILFLDLMEQEREKQRK